MSGTCCCVSECHLRGVHKFSSDRETRERWIKSIKRLDEDTLKDCQPSDSSVVCKAHFAADDYVKQTIPGYAPIQEKLLPTEVISQFNRPIELSPAQLSRGERTKVRASRKEKLEEDLPAEVVNSFQEQVDICEEIVETEESEFASGPWNKGCVEIKNSMAQTVPKPMFCVDSFIKDDKAIHFYTGLESYIKFMFVLNTLGEAAYCLNYIYHSVENLSVPNQFILTLMNLRRYTTNFELSKLFGISETSVKNIVFTWILFMAKQWHEINIWPPRNLVRYFTPSDYKSKFPTTRVIIDGTEYPIKKPNTLRTQQST